MGMWGVRGVAQTRFAQLKVMVTTADGTRVAKTLTRLAITEIDLWPDTTQVALPDGSRITGQAGHLQGERGYLIIRDRTFMCCTRQCSLTLRLST
jgi:hypothetical protein